MSALTECELKWYRCPRCGSKLFRAAGLRGRVEIKCGNSRCRYIAKIEEPQLTAQ